MLHRAGIDAASVDRRAQPPRPGDAFAFAQLQEQVELFGEEVVVVLEVVAEEREGFDEGAASGHDLGAAARKQVDGGESLEHADGIVGAQDADGTGEADIPGAHGGRAQHHRRRRDGIIGAVMLAHAENIQPDLIGEFDLLNQVPQPLRRGDVPPRFRVGADIGEGIEAKLHGVSSSTAPST